MDIIDKYINERIVQNYDDFVILLKEGLISTLDINRHHPNLYMELSSCEVKNKINIISKFQFELSLFDLDVDKYKIIKANHINEWILNILGYFPCRFSITLTNDMSNTFFFSEEKFSTELSNKNVQNIKITYEAKYDDGILKNTHSIPNVLYHLTPDDNIDKIKKNGLIPKSKNRKSNYPGRIYLFESIAESNFLLRLLKLNDKINNKIRTYSLIKLDLSGISSIVIHTDPNYPIGFYTYDNIAPYNLEFLQSGL